MHLLRLVATAAMVAVVTTLGATPALAAAPSNDTISGATSATLGESEVLDTSEATTDAVDAEANADCGAPATDASVWYSLTGTGTGVVVDVSTSTYSAGVAVVTGSPGSLTLITCGPGAVLFSAEAGTTYSIVAFDDQGDGGGNGGTLNISFTDLGAAPTLDLTLNPRGTVNSRTGVATISGTYACTGSTFVDLYGEVTQPVGRAYVEGFFSFFDENTCDGTVHTWSAQVAPEQDGKFAGGSTITVAIGFACGAWTCAEGYAEETVRLTGARR